MCLNGALELHQRISSVTNLGELETGVFAHTERPGYLFSVTSRLDLTMLTRYSGSQGVEFPLGVASQG